MTDDFTIRHYAKIGQSPLFGMAQRAASDLICHGLADKDFVIFPDREALGWFTPEGEPVAVLVFYKAAQTTVYLNMYYTVPAHRKRGLARGLIQELIKIASERGCVEVDAHVHTQNLSSQDALSGAGLEPYQIGYRITVPTVKPLYTMRKIEQEKTHENGRRVRRGWRAGWSSFWKS